MPIKAVSLDFWNTLFTEPPGGFQLYRDTRLRLLGEALRECGEFSAEEIDRACVLEAEAHDRIWREEHRTLATGERVRRVLDHLGARLSDAVYAELVRAHEEGVLERPPILIPGVLDALHEMRRHYRLGIISDVGFSPGRVLKHVLRENGIIELFDSLIFSDEAGRSKPHRVVFERTARSLGAAPGEMVHVGDLEFTDVAGAKRAGYRAIRFVGVTPLGPGEQSAADHVTDDFSSVPRLVESFA